MKRMGLLYVLSLFAVYLVVSGEHPKPSYRCDSARIKFDCKNYQGIFTSINGGEWNVSYASYGFEPISIPPYGRGIVLICNFENKFNEMPYGDQPTIPPLIRNIGDSAVVSVVVQNSGNRILTGTYKMHGQPHRKRSLVSSLINGPIGDRSQISIVLDNSANVLLKPDSSLHLKDSTLVSSLILANECPSNSCVDVGVYSSANIFSTYKYRSAVYLERASLKDAVVRAECVESSSVRVEVKESARIMNIPKVTISAGSALNMNMLLISKAKKSAIFADATYFATIDSSSKVKVHNSMLLGTGLELGTIENSKCLVVMDTVASVSSSSLSMTGRAVYYVGKITTVSEDSSVQLNLQNVGGVRAKHVEGFQGFHQFIYVVYKVDKSTLSVLAHKCGVAEVETMKLARNQALLREGVEVQRASMSKIKIDVLESFYVKLGKLLDLSEDGSRLIDKIVVARSAKDSVSIEAFLKRSVNIVCSGFHPKVKSGSNHLLETVAKLDGEKIRLNVSVQSSGNVFAAISEKSHVLKNILDGKESIGWLRVRENFVDMKLKCSQERLIFNS